MIKLWKSWDYAIKAVVYIAESSEELVKIKNISEDLKISQSFLRRIIATLEKWGIIKSIKWRNGWVKLAKEKNRISIYDILISSWENMFLTGCTKWEFCPKKEDCWTTRAFSSIQKWINSILKMNTLDKIIK